MKVLVASLCCALLVTLVKSEGGDLFCYNEESCGETHWTGQCNTGSRQSPVNLNFTFSNLFSNRTDLYVNDAYITPQNFILDNNGHTIQAKLQKDMTSQSVIIGNILGRAYTFSQLHFHWGAKNGSGSEHSVNNQFYDMEGHLVHYASKFNSLTEAIESNQTEAVAVIGLLYKVQNRTDNPSLTPILRAMEKTRSGGSTNNGTGLNLGAILPSRFYVMQYNGSLTTPGCAEVVLWNLLANLSYLSISQMEKFRALSDSHDGPLVNNFRSVQPLNERTVKYHFARVRRSS